MFEKILIANRGEIALRIHRACREIGIQTVAVHSTADADAMHVRLADESVCIGEAPASESYMNVPAILSAAIITGADAIHPGYGFLSEDANFAEIVAEHGFVFIGPKVEQLRLMGDKVAARKAVADAGLPVVPGSSGPVSEAEALATAEAIGYPLLVKAAGGGGGKGMKVANSARELRQALVVAKAEAGASFGDDRLYVERFFDRPRHIEVQVLADSQGHVVHLGERDCSLQRNHQKLLEEAPSPVLTPTEREQITGKVVHLVEQLSYQGLGTVEFLYKDGGFHFIEMNARLQVEHPVTEMITGIDVVREQIRVAAGEELGYGQEAVRFSGHAIECRITAEHPETFTPSPGRITDYHPPGGLGVRVDSALFTGYRVPPYYDSIIAKLIVHGTTRPECLMRLRRSLEEFVIGGIDTTIPLHQRLITEQRFIDGDYDTRWLEEFAGKGGS
jgi:acetyl-CoA carboxylase biotin carboxylase subunit